MRDSPQCPKRGAASNTLCTRPSPPWRVLSSASLGHGKGGAETRGRGSGYEAGAGAAIGAARGHGQLRGRDRGIDHELTQDPLSVRVAHVRRQKWPLLPAEVLVGLLIGLPRHTRRGSRPGWRTRPLGRSPLGRTAPRKDPVVLECWGRRRCWHCLNVKTPFVHLICGEGSAPHACSRLPATCARENAAAWCGLRVWCHTG